MQKKTKKTDDAGEAMHEELKGTQMNKPVMHIHERSESGGYEAEYHAAARHYK